jgi:hypothetical protein
MKKLLFIIMELIISAAFVKTGMAQDIEADSGIGKRIIITGRLHRGTSMKTYVLLNVMGRSADSLETITPVPIAIYWPDSNKGLEPLVGKMVKVTGKITNNAPIPETITISIDPSATLSTNVQIQGVKLPAYYLAADNIKGAPQPPANLRIK